MSDSFTEKQKRHWDDVAAALRLRPGGAMVAIDISPDMVAATSRAARGARLDNLDVLEMGAEDLRFASASFDAVVSAYGVMFCANPSRAVGEMRRVLAVDGRIALATWAEPLASPFFSVITQVAAMQLALPSPDPAAPGPFRLASAATLASLLRDTGFSDVEVDRLPMTCDCGTPADYCRLFRDVAWKQRMAALSDEESARFLDAVAVVAEPYLDAGRLRLVATSLCASGRVR